jgi:hypothetical protein
LEQRAPILPIWHDLADAPCRSPTMTNLTIPGPAQQDLEGRSVRDVVEYSHEQVNDVWCRKILRKILQSLELQYAMQMPHRDITPDTIVFHANGEPLLISDDIDAAPAPDSREADDLTALAHVLHYAITQELAPTGPLDGRVDGYSAALIATIDACMDPDPARRPRRVDAVRGLLGIVATEPPAGAVTLPKLPAAPGPDLHSTIVAGASDARMATAPTASAADIGSVPTGAAGGSAAGVPGLPSATSTESAFPPAAPPGPVERTIPDPVVGASLAGAGAPPDPPAKAHRAGMRRGRRWAIAASGGVIAVAIALLLSAELRDSGSYDHVALAPPQTGNGTQRGLPAPGGAASRGTVARDAKSDQAADGASNDPNDAAPETAPDLAGRAAGRTARNGTGDPTANRASDLVGSSALGASSGGTTLSGGSNQRDGTNPVASNPAGTAESVPATVTPAVSARAAAAAPSRRKVAADARAAVPPSAVSGKAIYQLQIKPWGVVSVDGVDLGVSPPLRRLALTPGRHTVRITNPKYRDSILEFDSAQTTSIGKIIVEFTDDVQ